MKQEIPTWEADLDRRLALQRGTKRFPKGALLRYYPGNAHLEVDFNKCFAQQCGSEELPERHLEGTTAQTAQVKRGIRPAQHRSVRTEQTKQ